MPVIKLRGLPWSVCDDDILKFLEGIKITHKTNDQQVNQPCIHLMTNPDGRPSGECFIELEDELDLESAIQKNNALMGQRYIEVFRSNYDQLNKHLEESASNASNWQDPVVRLRGLPYGCSKPEIALFFEGLNIAPDGIMMVIDFSGRFNGESFVTFDSLDDALDALNKHKQKIANRYIEVFRSTFDELNHYSAGSNPKNNRNDFKTRNSNKSRTSQFDNQRPKPYARNDNNRRTGNRPAPLMSNIFDATDDYSSNYNNDPSYVCEDNHTHYLNMAPTDNNSNYYEPDFKSDDFYEDNNLAEDEDDDINKYGVRMRGLPFSSTENDIRQFFEPLNPTYVAFINGKDRRSNGECEVFFGSHNVACEAMKYDKKFIGNRYIELFLLSGSMAGSNNQIKRTNQNSVPNQISFGSLMTKDFTKSSRKNFNSNEYSGDNSRFSGQSNINNNSLSCSSSSSSNDRQPANEMFFTDMAQNMFSFSYDHLNQKSFANNNNNNRLNRRY